MIKRLKSLSVLYRYIISYFLVVILPLGLLTFLIYNDNISYIHKDVKVMNLYRLEQAMDIFETRFKELHIVAYNIATDYRLKPDYLKENNYRVMEGVTSFNLHTRTNNFADQMFLYFRDRGEVYSKDGVMDVDTLTTYFYSLTLEEEERFCQRINSTITPSIIPARMVEPEGLKKSEAITFLYPVPLNSSQPYGTLIFSIEKNTISNLMSNILGGFEGNALILDSDMKPIISVNNQEFDFNDIIGAIKSDIYLENIKFNQKEYSLISTTSDSTSWTYILIMPAEKFLIRVIQQRTLIFQIAITVLVFGIGMGLCFAMANYRPIKRLMLVAEESNGWGKYNEIDRIENTVLNYIDTNKKLQRLVDTQSSYAKERIFELLLDEKIRKDEAYGLLNEVGIRFDRSYYCVIAIDNHQSMDNIQRSRFHQVVLTMIEEEEKKRIGCSLCAIERVNEKPIILVINFSNQGDEQILAKKLMEKLKSIENNILSSYSVLAIGKTYTSVLGLKKSFLEAMAAIEYTSMKREYGIFQFDDISNPDSMEYWYPMEEQLRFQQGIKQGDVDIVLQSLDEICTAISEKNNSTLMIRYVCFDIVNTVIKIISDINPNSFSVERLESIMSFNSLDEFRKSLETILLELCDNINVKKTSNNTYLRDQILEYVQLNFRDYNISLEKIAEEFSLSPNYVSRFFSEQTNCTFKDYITNLRIEETKKLLTITDWAINDIVQKIGYANVSSYIRKFKKEVGLTPGEYRKVFRESISTADI